VVLLVIYNAFVIPIELGIPEFESNTTTLLVLDIIIDTFFVADIIISFRTAYKDENGDMIRDFALIRTHYFKGSFPIDIAATLPLLVTITELALQSAGNGEEEYQITEVLSVLSLLKCIRLFRLSRLIKFLQRFKVGNALKLLWLFMFFSLAAHSLACLTIKFSTLTEDENSPGWFYILKDEPWSKQYVSGLYFMTTTLTTVGYGDFSPETTKEQGFFVVVMMIGSILYATILGSITSIITGMNKLEGQFINKMDSINGYMREHSLPADLQANIRGYYEFMWVRHKTFNMSENVLAELPETLSLKVLDHTHRHVMDQSVVFRELPQTFQRVVAKILQPIIETPNEYIYVQGEECEAIYFVRHGEVQLRIDDQVLSTRVQGGYFGDEGIWGKPANQESETDNECTNHVDAYTPKYCDMYYVTREDLEQILNDFKGCKTVIVHVAEQRYNMLAKRKYVDDESLLHKIVPRALSKAGRSMVDSLSPNNKKKSDISDLSLKASPARSERKKSIKLMNGFPGITVGNMLNDSPPNDVRTCSIHHKYLSSEGIGHTPSAGVVDLSQMETYKGGRPSDVMKILQAQTEMLQSLQKSMKEQEAEIKELKGRLAEN